MSGAAMASNSRLIPHNLNIILFYSFQSLLMTLEILDVDALPNAKHSLLRPLCATKLFCISTIESVEHCIKVVDVPS